MTVSSMPAAPGARAVLAIASYNGRALLEQMLPSVAAQSFGDLRVVVVDDASDDDTVAWLRECWPEVEVVALEVNRGVTAAFNACVRAAGDAELVALFNNDVELDPDCIGGLVQALDEHPGAAFAAAKLVDFRRRDVLDGAGDVFDWAGTGWRRGHGEPDRGQYDQSGPIFGACGGAALYRTSAFAVVGEFYEPFFAFSEDVDWSFRARLAGLHCRYVPAAVAYHMGSATLGAGMTDFTRYQITRNTLWLVARDYPVSALVRHAPRVVYVQAATFARCALDGQLRPWARAWRDALRALPEVLRDRRRVQRRRRVSLRALESAVAER